MEALGISICWGGLNIRKNNSRSLALYDKNKKVSISNDSASTTNDTEISFDVPINAYYVRASSAYDACTIVYTEVDYNGSFNLESGLDLEQSVSQNKIDITNLGIDTSDNLIENYQSSGTDTDYWIQDTYVYKINGSLLSSTSYITSKPISLSKNVSN